MTVELFEYYLETVYLPTVESIANKNNPNNPNNKEQHSLLILDCYSAHFVSEPFQRKHPYIHFVYIPPSYTFVCQALDVLIFK